MCLSYLILFFYVLRINLRLYILLDIFVKDLCNNRSNDLKLLH